MINLNTLDCSEYESKSVQVIIVGESDFYLAGISGTVTSLSVQISVEDFPSIQRRATFFLFL